jgi:hypothetical protein
VGSKAATLRRGDMRRYKERLRRDRSEFLVIKLFGASPREIREKSANRAPRSNIGWSESSSFHMSVDSWRPAAHMIYCEIDQNRLWEATRQAQRLKI